jgi:hypothetical protein
MIEMRITSDFKKAAKKLGVAKKQLPFVIALTLTRVAQEAQQELKEDLVSRFVSRGAWVPRSIRIRPARKGPAPESIVGTLYRPMVDHVTGGDKTPQQGRAVAIPVRARHKPRQRTTPSKWPGALLSRPNFFSKQLEGGSLGIFERMRGKARKTRLWWVLTDRVQIKKAWPWEAIAAHAADESMLRLFAASWDRAQGRSA